MDPHPFPLSLLRGACSGSLSEDMFLSREEQAGVASGEGKDEHLHTGAKGLTSA